jgi:hypothetical protein
VRYLVFSQACIGKWEVEKKNEHSVLVTLIDSDLIMTITILEGASAMKSCEVL